MSAETIGSAAADAAAAPLDLLLTDAALGVLNRVNPGGSGLRLAAALAARPRLVASRTRNLLGELTRIAAGTSQIEPSRRDRRFTDPGWAGNPLLRRVLQGYLAAAQTAEGLAQDADLDWADTERAGFVRHARWDFGTYGRAVLDAMDAVARITGSEQTAVTGVCSGGIIAAMVAAYLAHTGRQDQIAALTLMVTVLDQSGAGLGSAVISERNARLAAAASAARGYLDGRSLAEVFAWQRPNDLIWNYWVNNYLLGRTPPPFDILSWNADTTRMTAGLHRDFLQMGVSNALTRPGGVTMLGSPVDLAIDRDSYLVAGIADHICPWQSCYRSTGLLGGNKRFVLSTSGHIAAMVNPPATPRPGTRWPRTARKTPRSGCGVPRPATGPGGRTTRPGWPSAAGRKRPLPPS
jgi:alpha/beta hydrolase fold